MPKKSIFIICIGGIEPVKKTMLIQLFRQCKSPQFSTARYYYHMISLKNQASCLNASNTVLALSANEYPDIRERVRALSRTCCTSALDNDKIVCAFCTRSAGSRKKNTSFPS